MSSIGRLLDWAWDHMVLTVIGLLAILVLLGWTMAQYELSNPCLQRGPREVAYYQRIGDMVIPIYHEPCLVRQGDSK